MKKGWIIRWLEHAETMGGAPPEPDYWRAIDELGFDQVGLMLPTLPPDKSLRLLDAWAAVVACYRG